MQELILTAALMLPIQSDGLICGKREGIVTQLENKYGETPQVMGFSKGAGVIEVYGNEDTETWTIIVTGPDGISCFMASGEAFEVMSVKGVKS